jgi:hydroxyacylglutathione hydrolase
LPTVISIPDEGLGNSSYLVDLDDGRALVVDPRRDAGIYLAAAEVRGLDITHCAETHLHADFVTGSMELASNGVIVLASAAGGLEFSHRGLEDGDEVDLGGHTLRAVATPGHTPEHIAYLLADGPTPLALFSGGSLLPGSAARTDLIAPDETEPLARDLYRSVHERLFNLTDDLSVYPTHGTGATFCAAAPGGQEKSTTIGREKLGNPLFSAADEDSFVKVLLSGFGTYPPYFHRLREVNRRGPRVYGMNAPPLRGLPAAEVQHLTDEGAQLLDVRPISDFAAGHIPGALSNALRPVFATWLGWLVPEGLPLVFVLNDDQDRADLVWQCLKVGYEKIAGELDGGMASWRDLLLPENRINLVKPDELATGWSDLVDVRQASEFAAGHIPGARNIELGSVSNQAGGMLSSPVTLMCGHGERSMTAAAVLERGGHQQLSVLNGGPEDWRRASGGSLDVCELPPESGTPGKRTDSERTS